MGVAVPRRSLEAAEGLRLRRRLRIRVALGHLGGGQRHAHALDLRARGEVVGHARRLLAGWRPPGDGLERDRATAVRREALLQPARVVDGARPDGVARLLQVAEDGRGGRVEVGADVPGVARLGAHDGHAHHAVQAGALARRRVGGLHVAHGLRARRDVGDLGREARVLEHGEGLPLRAADEARHLGRRRHREGDLVGREEDGARGGLDRKHRALGLAGALVDELHVAGAGLREGRLRRVLVRAHDVGDHAVRAHGDGDRGALGDACARARLDGEDASRTLVGGLGLDLDDEPLLGDPLRRRLLRKAHDRGYGLAAPVLEVVAHARPDRDRRDEREHEAHEGEVAVVGARLLGPAVDGVRADAVLAQARDPERRPVEGRRGRGVVAAVVVAREGDGDLRDLGDLRGLGSPRAGRRDRLRRLRPVLLVTCASVAHQHLPSA